MGPKLMPWWLVVDDEPGRPMARGGWHSKEVAEFMLKWEAGARNPKIIRATTAEEATQTYEREFKGRAA